MSDSDSDEATEKQLKVVFVGEPNVGKTSIIKRFCYDEFTRQYNQTIGADFYVKRISLSGRKEVCVRITDVGGQEMNGSMLANYLFNSDMIVLVYDITNFASFERLLLWMERVAKHEENPAYVAVFGNKCDLEHKRAVRLDKTQSFVDEFRLLNFLVSAKTGENVNLCLTNLIAQHFDMSLSKVDKEIQTALVKAELVPATPVVIKNKTVTAQSSSTRSQRVLTKLKLLATGIYSIINTMPIFSDSSYTLLFHHVKAFIEKYTENIRFCIICNYLSKIIPALQSRCTRFRFGPLSPEQILPRLNYVIDEEKVKITDDGRKALLTLANGDMRKVLNVLQSTWLAYKNVTEDNVYTCVGHPLRTDIENIVKWLLNDNIDTTYKNIKELKILKGLALTDILTEVHKFVLRIEFPFEVMVRLLDKMAEIEHRLSAGTSENIQLMALISSFHYAKQLNPPDGSAKA